MLTRNSASNIIGWINNAATANAGKKFAVSKWRTHVELFAVHEDGSITVHGTVQNGAEIFLENTSSGTVEIVSFRKDGAEKLVIAYDASAGEVHLRTGENGSTDHHLQLRATKDVILVFGGSGIPLFTIVDDAGVILYEIDINGAFYINKSGTNYASLDYSGTGDVTLRVGTADAGRGRVTIADDTSAGTNPGYVVLESRNYTDANAKACCLWVSGGKLMIAKGTVPSGTIVAGNQITGLW